GLLKLPPHFDKDSGQGTVTAGNSSQLSDGASATLLMSMDRAKALGVKPKLIFRGFAVAGCEPDEMGIGPVYAIPKLLKRQGLKGRYGVVTMCIGGGQGAAGLFEACN